MLKIVKLIDEAMLIEFPPNQTAQNQLHTDVGNIFQIAQSVSHWLQAEPELLLELEQALQCDPTYIAAKQYLGYFMKPTGGEWHPTGTALELQKHLQTHFDTPFFESVVLNALGY